MSTTSKKEAAENSFYGAASSYGISRSKSSTPNDTNNYSTGYDSLTSKEKDPRLDSHFALAAAATNNNSTQDLSHPCACAAEALNVLLQRNGMRLPTFDYKLERDHKGRSVFTTTIEVKGVQGTGREYSKKACKQIAADQLLTNISKRYPKVKIPFYYAPTSNNSSSESPVSIPKQEIWKPAPVKQSQGEDMQDSSRASEEKVSHMRTLVCLAREIKGIEPPKFLDVSQFSITNKYEFLCTLGSEVRRGFGNTEYEAKENSAFAMLSLLNQNETTKTVVDFKVTDASEVTKQALADLPPEIKTTTTKRNDNDMWMTELTVTSCGIGNSKVESLAVALGKALEMVTEAMQN